MKNKSFYYEHKRLFSKIIFIPTTILFCVLFTSTTTALAVRPQCVLSLTATSQTKTVTPGGTMDYLLTIKNNGTRQCNEVRLSVYYDSNETYMKSTPVPTRSTDYYWYVGALRSGQSTKVNITTKSSMTSRDEIINSSCLSATGAKDSCTDITTIVNSAQVAPPATIATTTVISQPTPIDVPVAASTSEISSKEYGVWVWDSPYQMGLTRSKQVVDQASANGFRSIYVTIDDYLTINAMPNGTQKTQAINNYNVAVEQFINYANQKGIAVDSVAGWRDWAKPELRYKAYAIMDYVINYNNTHNIKFRNIQYDVEPYLLPEYETNKAPVLLNFVEMIDQLVLRNTSSAGITMVIPHFYDSAQNWTPKITFNGKTLATFTHILNILDSKPNNSVTLMSYRDHADGADGTIQISKPEIDEASSVGHKVKIYIAQETGNVDPNYVTFYGKTKSDLAGQVNVINSAFTNSSAFGGISIHYLDPFLQLP